MMSTQDVAKCGDRLQCLYEVLYAIRKPKGNATLLELSVHRSWYDSAMALSINDQDARDLELQREIQEAREVFLGATGDERPDRRRWYHHVQSRIGGKTDA